MSKTLVVPRHAAGPATNGYDGCFARFANGGICPGVETAAWLNDLGDDLDEFGGTTCGEVRENWLRGENHIVAKNPHLAELYAEQRDLKRRLTRVQWRLKQAENERGER